MPDPEIIVLDLTREEANAVLDGIDDLVTSSATANLLASVRAKIEEAFATPLNHELNAEPIASKAKS